MSQDDAPPTFLLLNSTLPSGSVRLGRFVRLPYHPESEYRPETPSIPSHLIFPSLEGDIEKILINDKTKEGLRLKLASLIAPQATIATAIHKAFSTKIIMTRRFVNSGSQLGSMLKDVTLKTWLKEPAQVRAGKVFLVVGMKSFFDAQVIEWYKNSRDIPANTAVSNEEVLRLLASPDSHLSQISGETGSANKSTRVGEHIFAVEYRPLKIKTLELKDVQQLGKSTYGPEKSEKIDLRVKDLVDEASGLFILVSGSNYIQLELGEVDADELDIEESIFQDNRTASSFEAAEILSGETLIFQA